MDSPQILLGKTSKLLDVAIRLDMLNRHGLIAGATGTGKTVTLQRLVDELSQSGIPVFTADVKGDLAGLCLAGGPTPRLTARIEELGLPDPKYSGNPAILWDLAGQAGLPLRTTLAEVGPIILAQMLGLNETQSGTLQALFRAADSEGLMLLDTKDLGALITWASENLASLSSSHGLMSKQTLAVIQRSLLNLEDLGGDRFFGEPALNIEHLMQRDFSGRGVVSVLDATKVVNNPKIYCSFLMWLLSELFEALPENGDSLLPKLVFFFDEAHLLFRDASTELLEKIERLVKLIRSKGVGVYFITQNPADIPSAISAQLGLRIQHALRAYSEQERKSLKAVAQSFRLNPEVNIGEALEKLAIGEALVSVLDGSGVPTPVQLTKIAPPRSRIGPLDAKERTQLIAASPLTSTYRTSTDRESAFELLSKRRLETAKVAPAAQQPSRSERQGIFESFIKSTVRTLGSQFGRQIVRGIMGSIMRTK